MKNFIIAMVIFALSVALVIYNAAQVNSITGKLEDYARMDSVNDLKLFWDKKRTFLALSVHRCTLENADKALAEMIEYRNIEDSWLYNAAKEKYLLFLKEISDGEKIGI